MKNLLSEIWEWMKKEWRSLMIIALVTVVAYVTILPNQFVWDDGYFVGWPGYRGETLDISGILEGKVPMAYGQVYRPLRGLWYIVSVAVWDMWPVGYHIQGIFVHLVITMMVYWIAEKLVYNSLPRLRSGSPLKRESQWIALVTALIFGTHPIHTEAVSWITASFDTIGIGFMFGSLIAWIKSVKCRVLSVKSEAKWKYTSLILAFLAFFTYELTFVLVGIIVFYEWIVRSEKWRRAVQVTTPYIFLIVCYFVVKAMVLPPDVNRLPWLFGGFFEAIVFAPVIISSYVRFMIVPIGLSTNHLIYPTVSNLYYADGGILQPPSLNVGSPYYFIPLLGLIVAGFGVWWFGKKNRLIWFGGLWTLISLLPVLQLIPLNSVFAERYTYISSFGVCLLIAMGINKIQDTNLIGWQATYKIQVVAIFVGLLMILTIQRNRVWGTTVTLWEDAVTTGPESAYAYRNLGASYYIYKEYDQAIEYYLKAQAAQPSHFETYQKLVYLYGLIGDQGTAQLQMELAEKQFPEKFNR